MAQVYQKRDGAIVAGRRAWYIDWTDAAGRRHRERTYAQTKVEAEVVLRAKLSQNAKCEILGTTDQNLVKPVLFKDFYEKEYLPQARLENRESTYKRKLNLAEHLLPTFGGLTLRAINAGHIEKFMQKREAADPKPSPAEINKERALLSDVLSTAFRRGLVDLNPVGRVEKLREDNARDRWLTVGEVKLIFDKAEEWVRPFILLAVQTGLRAGEICSLRWQDLDGNPGFIRVDAERSKTHKPRHVPINSAVKEILDAQTRHIGPAGPVPWVLLNTRRRKAFKVSSVSHSFKRAVRKAAAELRKDGKHTDIDATSFHATRHTFASWLIQKGVPIAEVQQYLGHGSDTMTRRYAHLAPATSRGNVLEVLVSGVDAISGSTADQDRRAL